METEIKTDNLSPEEKKFLDLINHGDDLLNIEILRNAKEYYQLALQTHVNDNLALDKIKECDAKLRFERKVILVLSIIAGLVIALMWIF